MCVLGVKGVWKKMPPPRIISGTALINRATKTLQFTSFILLPMKDLKSTKHLACTAQIRFRRQTGRVLHKSCQLLHSTYFAWHLLEHIFVTVNYTLGHLYCPATRWLSRISPLMYTFPLRSVMPHSSGASLWHQLVYLATCCALTSKMSLGPLLSHFTY